MKGEEAIEEAERAARSVSAPGFRKVSNSSDSLTLIKQEGGSAARQRKKRRKKERKKKKKFTF